MIWRTFMLAPEFGIVDYLAINAGIGSRNWLGDPLLAMISVIVIHTWQWTPFAFMVLLASLASLPEDIYEAARLANYAGGLVVMKRGTATVSAEELRSAVQLDASEPGRN